MALISINNIILRRDDFAIRDVNGGKLRQAIILVEKNLLKIKGSHNNSLTSYSSVNSAQSAIIATVCKDYDINCNIVTFGTKTSNINLSIAQNEGAKIYRTKAAYTKVLRAFSEKNFSSSFLINTGFTSEYAFTPIINLVKEIPQVIDSLVIPVGSGMNFVGILHGIEKFNKKVKSITGVWVGSNPHQNITRYYKGKLDYKLIKYNKPYSTPKYHFDLDPFYEAKAFDWIINNPDLKRQKVLLWEVGRPCKTKYLKTIKYDN